LEHYAADLKLQFTVIVRNDIDNEGEFLYLRRGLGSNNSHAIILVNQSLKEYGLKLKQFVFGNAYDQVTLSVVD